MFVDTARQASSCGPSLLTGTEFRATVVAYDEDGALLGAEHTSFTPDETAATFYDTAAVTDGQLLDGVYCAPSTSALALSWEPFLDAEGDVAYSAALGTSPYGEQVQGYSAPLAGPAATWSGLYLVTGTKYYMSVIDTNEVGPHTVFSKPVVVDITPPDIGSVHFLDATGNEMSLLSDAAQVTCGWTGVQDVQAPVVGIGVELVEVTAAGTGSIVPPSNVLSLGPGEAQATFSPGGSGVPDPLPEGKFLACRAKATNAAGLARRTVGRPAPLATGGPTAGVVRDGARLGGDVDFSADCSQAAANWDSFVDPSGIATYEVALGSAAGLDDVMPWTVVAQRTAWAATGLMLAPGSTVYNSMCATNMAGHASVASSDGFACDETLPSLSGTSAQALLLTAFGIGDPAGRSTCACADPNVAFVPDFTHGGGVCQCGPGFVLNATSNASSKQAQYHPCSSAGGSRWMP